MASFSDDDDDDDDYPGLFNQLTIQSAGTRDILPIAQGHVWGMSSNQLYNSTPIK